MPESRKRQKTKRIFEAAVAGLLEDQSFDQITTVQLVEAAGLSRSSFYTHYKDKYDMVEQYQDRLFHQLEEIFDQQAYQKREAFVEVLTYFDQEPFLAALLSENGTKEVQSFLRHKLQLLIATDLQDHYLDQETSPIKAEYRSVYLAHALFGVCQSWIARGKKESPQEMADFLTEMLGS